MKESEINFLNFYFTNVVVDKNSTAAIINKAYFILNDVTANDNCNQCIKSRKEELDGTYISLVKIQQPVYINNTGLDDGNGDAEFFIKPLKTIKKK